MRSKHLLILLVLLPKLSMLGQIEDNTALLKIILSKAYENEKPIVKNRLQLLTFYCDKAPNNEELLEVIAKNELLKKNADQIKKQINPTLQENWKPELESLFNNQHQYLKSKVQECVTLEEFISLTEKFGENNQRLLVVSKPIYFAQKYCLVKVVYFRNIEHNSGFYYLFEKNDQSWVIVDTLNKWST